MGTHKYVKTLFGEAARMERTDINGRTDDSFRARYGAKALCAAVSLAVAIPMRDGLGNGFISLVSTVLPVSAGFLAVALVFTLDRFHAPHGKRYPTSREKLWEIQDWNHAKRFAHVTGRAIVQCLFCLGLLGAGLLCGEAVRSGAAGAPAPDWATAPLSAAWRSLLLYWLLRIAHAPLFVTASTVMYMTVKMDRKR